jgi:hypothetical protein
MKKFWILFALLLITETCMAQPMMSWYTEAHGDTLGVVTLDKKVNAWFSATKGWQYTNPKTLALAGTSEDSLKARLTRMEAKLARTRRDLAKEVKKRVDLETKYGKGK